ncbi:MAG: Ig-like domain repeat protein [Candidatus Izemoplasmatales bacterium]|nr:Ig-like domain repeat protein [Candidatus Izemoplasmatales bacterium]
MKQGWLIVWMLCGMLLCGTNRIHGANVHCLPGGRNYLSEDYFVLEGTDYYTETPFLVKPYTTYLLSVPRDYLEYERPTVVISFYHDDDFEWSEVIDYTAFADVPDLNVFTVTFMTDTGINYIQINFTGESGYFARSDFSFTGFMLEEGEIYTEYEPFIEGVVVDATAPYFLSAGRVISYVDTPISASEIQEGLIAYDAIDGDVTDMIEIKADHYSPNQTILGDYVITFSVTDTSGNETEIDVLVCVVDMVMPVFSDVGIVQAVYPNVYALDALKAMVQASDNYDGDVSHLIMVDTDGYTSYADVVGGYEVSFFVEDQSGNRADYTLYIEVVDCDEPIISGTTTIAIGYDRLITPQYVKSGLHVIDNYDLQATLELELVHDTYTPSNTTLGDYEMVFSVRDSSGNIATQTITIHVIDEVGPLVYFDRSVIRVYNDWVLSLGDVITLMGHTGELDLKNDYQLLVTYDSYSKHAHTPGTYHLAFDIENTQGDVISKTLEINVSLRPTDYEHIGVDVPKADTPRGIENPWIFLASAMATIVFLSNGLWLIALRKKKTV